MQTLSKKFPAQKIVFTNFLFSLLCIAIPAAAETFANTTELFAGEIPKIEIRIEPDSLTQLRTTIRNYVKCKVWESTNSYVDVGIHLKGQYGTFQGIDGKPSLTLKFDKFVDGQLFRGLTKIHLNNCGQDPSYLCEIIGREIFNQAKVPTPRATHAQIRLNGKDLGIFVLVEGYDKQFLAAHFKNPQGNLYDSEFRHEITEPLKKSRGKGPDDHSDLTALATALAETDPQLRLAAMSKILDTDEMIRFTAVEALIRHFDGYSMGVNNYRIYFDPISNRATMMPGGMDQVFFQSRATAFIDARGVLASSLLETRHGGAEFRKHCTNLFPSALAALSNRVETLHIRLKPLLAQLDSATQLSNSDATASLLRRIRQRSEHLQTELYTPVSRPFSETFGTVPLTNWISSVESGAAKLEQVCSNGNWTYRMSLSPGNDGSVARWQSRVVLEAGRYKVSAVVLADTPIFHGAESLISLSLWAIPNYQVNFLRFSPTSAQMNCTFEIAEDSDDEYVLRCEGRTRELPVVYIFSGLTIERLK